MPQTCNAGVGALSWPAGVFVVGGGAPFGPARRAERSGSATGANAGDTAAHPAALERLVGPAISADAIVADRLCALHAAGVHRATASQLAGALYWCRRRSADAAAGLSFPPHGRTPGHVTR